MNWLLIRNIRRALMQYPKQSNTVITVGAQDAAPANSVIKQLYQNFLDGCSRIAAAITGGRDGSGAGGVATAGNASVATMVTNIRTLANQNYDQGISYADGRVNDSSASYSAGASAARISGGMSGDIFSRSTTGAMTYTIPVSTQYKYVMVLCSDTDGGNNSTASASMTGALISTNAPTTSHNSGYSYAKIMIGLASVSHTFTWPKDAWEFSHSARAVYFN